MFGQALHEYIFTPFIERGGRGPCAHSSFLWGLARSGDSRFTGGPWQVRYRRPAREPLWASATRSVLPAPWVAATPVGCGGPQGPRRPQAAPEPPRSCGGGDGSAAASWVPRARPWGGGDGPMASGTSWVAVVATPSVAATPWASAAAWVRRHHTFDVPGLGEPDNAREHTRSPEICCKVPRLRGGQAEDSDT